MSSMFEWLLRKAQANPGTLVSAAGETEHGFAIAAAPRFHLIDSETINDPALLVPLTLCRADGFVAHDRDSATCQDCLNTHTVMFECEWTAPGGWNKCGERFRWQGVAPDGRRAASHMAYADAVRRGWTITQDHYGVIHRECPGKGDRLPPEARSDAKRGDR